MIAITENNIPFETPLLFMNASLIYPCDKNILIITILIIKRISTEKCRW